MAATLAPSRRRFVRGHGATGDARPAPPQEDQLGFQVLADSAAGLSRAEIGQRLGLSGRQVRRFLADKALRVRWRGHIERVSDWEDRHLPLEVAAFVIDGGSYAEAAAHFHLHKSTVRRMVSLVDIGSTVAELRRDAWLLAGLRAGEAAAAAIPCIAASIADPCSTARDRAVAVRALREIGELSIRATSTEPTPVPQRVVEAAQEPETTLHPDDAAALAIEYRRLKRERAQREDSDP